MPGVVINGLGNFHQKLSSHAKDLFTAFGLYIFDERSDSLGLAPDIDERRAELMKRKHIIPAWLSFHTAVECLFKAVLLKHEVPIISRRNVTNRDAVLRKKASNYSVCLEVYDWPKGFVADASKWPWLQRELSEHNIHCSFDIDTTSIGRCKKELSQLVQKDKMSKDECDCLHNALTVFCDIRRNTDAHTFFGWTVGGSINGDLENVYLPMVNLLFDIYHRP